MTVSYNQAEFLEACLRSVVGQRQPVEYIVMDGGSTDGSAEIIARYADRITYWCSRKDKGPANALNMGFSMATGDYIGYINSDDYLLADSLRKLEAFIRRNPGYDVYYGPGYILDEIKSRMIYVRPTRWHLGVYRAERTVMFQQSIFIRTEKLREAGITFNEANTTHWDGEHLVDLDLAGATFCRHNIPIGVFRIHRGSLTGGAQGDRWQKKYKEQVKLVADKIDRARPQLIRSRFYWTIWLLAFDPLVMLHRIWGKLDIRGKLGRRRLSQVG